MYYAETSALGLSTKKKRKLEGAPKRPNNPYSLWLNDDIKARIKQENPNAKGQEINKLFGAEWKALSDEEKQPYIDSTINSW
jgi:hypothetical protein